LGPANLAARGSLYYIANTDVAGNLQENEMLHGFFRKIAPIAAMAMATGLAGCDNMNIKMGGTEGVPLADLDLSGEAPTELALAGPDTVIVSDGEKLAITVEGDQSAVDALRFSLKDGTLGIMRDNESWKNAGNATVRVTMPSPNSLILLASGTIEAASLSGAASVQILGSGKVSTASVNADSLDLNILGSGSYEAAGVTKGIDLTVAGSGSANMAGLKADGADISIMGSGNAEFASDGAVTAEIMGAGNVTVIGNATCTVNSMGSGTVTCKAGGSEAGPEEETTS
jgi:hypothetical protein